MLSAEAAADVAALDVESIQQREGRWVIVDLVGKGRTVRTVPMPSWVKAAIDVWTTAAEITSGRLFRSVNLGGKVWGFGLTEKVIWPGWAPEAGFTPETPSGSLSGECSCRLRSSFR